jgi:hypothetical protein
MRLTQVNVHQELYQKANGPSEIEVDVRLYELLTSAKRTYLSLFSGDL